METWRPISGYEGRYEVSDLGRVRSVERMAYRPDGTHGRKVKGHIMAISNTDARGALQVGLNKDGVQTIHPLHRLVLNAFVGLCPDDMECCHSDGNASNNRLSNLRWDTKSSNAIDRLSHGVQHTQLLNPTDVERIRDMRRFGVGPKAIGSLFQVSPSNVSNICARRTWLHV